MKKKTGLIRDGNFGKHQHAYIMPMATKIPQASANG
jgi:hypothetical protein